MHYKSAFLKCVHVFGKWGTECNYLKLMNVVMNVIKAQKLTFIAVFSRPTGGSRDIFIQHILMLYTTLSGANRLLEIVNVRTLPKSFA